MEKDRQRQRGSVVKSVIVLDDITVRAEPMKNTYKIKGTLNESISTYEGHNRTEKVTINKGICGPEMATKNKEIVLYYIDLFGDYNFLTIFLPFISSFQILPYTAPCSLSEIHGVFFFSF